MGTISITTPSDGQTIDASDVATPLNTIVTEINGSLDSNNIADGGVVPNSLTSGTGTSWVWQSWTPTWSGTAVSNSTVTGKYIQIGKLVFFRLNVVFAGGDAPSGNTTFTLPVTATTYPGASTPFGLVNYEDSGTASRFGRIRYSSTTQAQVVVDSVSGSYIAGAALSAAVPFTWANGDSINIHGFYEAA